MLKRYKANFALLQEIAQQIGKEYEKKPYQELHGGSADISEGELEVRGLKVSYSAYSFTVKKTGDVGFCIDVRAALPTPFGVRPSYQFFKRPDGTVYC